MGEAPEHMCVLYGTNGVKISELCYTMLYNGMEITLTESFMQVFLQVHSLLQLKIIGLLDTYMCMACIPFFKIAYTNCISGFIFISP